MKLSKNPLRALYVIWLVLVVCFVFLFIYPLVWWSLSDPKRYKIGHRLRRLWGNVVLLLGMSWVQMKYEEPIDPTKVYIITPNHTSYLDIATMTAKLNMLYFSFLGKAELLSVPLFNIWFRSIDIPVDRKNARKSAEAYIKAKKLLKQGMSLVIFPEGTISDNVPELLPFKDGPFRMAIEQQVDILPVTIIGNHRIFSDARKIVTGGPGIVTHFVHKAISTKGMSIDDTEALKLQVFNLIQQKLREYGY